MSEYYDVTAVSSERENLQKYGLNENVDTFYLPLTRKITPWTDIRCVIKLYRFLKKEKPLIVHSHTPKAGIIAMMAAWLAKVPLRFHTVAGLPLMEASGIKRRILNMVEKWTYKFATKVYPNSLGLKEIILKQRFCEPSKLEVLGEGSSNGIDSSYFSRAHFSEMEIAQKKSAIGIPDSDMVLVFVGRIVKDKGINELVSAFKKLQKDTADCSLLLVGPFEDDLDPVSDETRTSINTNTKIFAVGYQIDVRIYLAMSDILVFPSYREGFPNVVMQAGAMDVPAIVSNINGCNEIIDHGTNGLIISVKSTNELYSAMKKLISDRSLYKKLLRNARQQIVSRYERQKMWKLILTEYREQESKFKLN